MISRLKVALAALLILALSACSTTTSSVRDVMGEVDRSELSFIRMAVTGSEIQTAFQDSSRLYELHSRSDEVLDVAKLVTRYYGFTLVSEEDADFVLDIKQAIPDGGARQLYVWHLSCDVWYRARQNSALPCYYRRVV